MELKIREHDMKAKNASAEDLKQSLIETRKELAKEVKDSGGGGGAFNGNGGALNGNY